MISTRLHGVIDYGVAAAFAGLAASRALPSPVRGVLAGAAAYHTAYALLTDYEAGIRPRFDMRQHLWLDRVGAAALCGAGLLMSRQRPSARALLFASGVTELAVIARSSADPVSGPGEGSIASRLLGLDPASSAHRVGYAPLDTPKPVAPGVFIVDSLMTGPLSKVVPIRMTVIRLPGGDLVLHSPTQFSAGLARELLALGRIRHIVAPNSAHWVFMGQWQRAFPRATTWAAPGLRDRAQVRRSGIRLDIDLADGAPRAWNGAVEVVVVPGALGFREAALFHRPSRTLVLTDLVLNLEPRKVPLLLRPVVRLFGSTAPDGMPPPYLRAAIKGGGPAARDAAARLLRLQPERVLFTHGRWFASNGTAALARSLRWLLPG